MSRRRIAAWILVFVSIGMAVAGFGVYIIATLIELFNDTAILENEVSSTMQLGLAGLGLATLMVTFGFILVGILLARQSRQLAPGYGDAYRFMQSFQFVQAIPLLEKAVDSGRLNPELLMLLTSAYAHTGQIGKAQATADRAVQLYPSDASAYISLANGYRVQASYDEAARALAMATQLAPQQSTVWAELGFVYQLAGDDEQAYDAFIHATKDTMPSMYSVRVYYHLSRYYRTRNETEKALASTAKMLSARDGIEAWRIIQQTLEGTVYGTALRYEISAIDSSIEQADSAMTSIVFDDTKA